MTAPTKADLRSRIDELGGTQPPTSATRADLVAAVDALAEGAPAAPPAVRVARPRSQSCPGGRPLFNTDICRLCWMRGIVSCPKV